MSDQPTFLEDRALYAVLREDEEELQTILDQMLPGELQDLARAAETLASEAWHTLSIKRLNASEGSK